MVDLSIRQFTSNLDNDTKWKHIQDGIEQAITLGITQTETARQLRDFGYSFGNTPFNQLFRSRREYRVGFEYITTLDDDEIPDYLQMSTKGWLEEGKYQYVLEYDIFDEITGETIQYRTSEISDTLLSKGEIEGAIQNTNDITSPIAGLIAESARVIGAFRGIA